MRHDNDEQKAAHYFLHSRYVPGLAVIVLISCMKRIPFKQKMNYYFQRHSGRECRNPGHMDVMPLTIHGFWAPATLPGR